MMVPVSFWWFWGYDPEFWGYNPEFGVTSQILGYIPEF